MVNFVCLVYLVDLAGRAGGTGHCLSGLFGLSGLSGGYGGRSRTLSISAIAFRRSARVLFPPLLPFNPPALPIRIVRRIGSIRAPRAVGRAESGSFCLSGLFSLSRSLGCRIGKPNEPNKLKGLMNQRNQRCSHSACRGSSPADRRVWAPRWRRDWWPTGC